MSCRRICLGVLLLVTACGGTTSSGTSTSSSGGGDPSSAQTAACEDSPGLSYDVTKSKFAFGGTPTKSEMNGLIRWVGPQGALVISPLGDVNAVTNAGVSGSDWSADAAALTAHVRAYLVSLGIAECQIAKEQVLGGSNGRTISFSRAVAGIDVVSSTAAARMNADDKSTQETIRWPTVPSATVTAAKSFRDQLADPAGLAAYRAKLPANAQGEGAVVIQHTVMFTKPMRFDVTWSVNTGYAVESFDTNGAKLSGVW